MIFCLCVSVCVCVLNGLWDGKYELIMRWCSSNTQSGSATCLDSASYSEQLLSTPPAPPVSVTLLIILFPPSPTTPPISIIQHPITDLFISPYPQIIYWRVT